MLRSRVGYVGKYTGRSRDREVYPTQQGRSALGSPRGEEHDRADDHGETTHHWRHEPPTLGGDFDGTDVHFLPLLGEPEAAHREHHRACYEQYDPDESERPHG